MEPIADDIPPSGYSSIHESGQPLLGSPPAAQPLNWLLLLQVASINIGSHYNQHCLSSLFSQIMALFNANRTEYGLLFTSQELPGIALALLSGLILVYVPHAPAAVFLAASVTISTVLCAVAVDRRSYALLMAGRFLFGLTQGALTTVQGAIIARKFSRHVGTGFGVMLFTSRLSSFAGLVLPAFFAQRFGLVSSMWISTLATLPPLAATILYLTTGARPPRGSLSISPDGATDEQEDEPPTTQYISPLQLARSFPPAFWLVCYLWIVMAGVVYTLLHFAPDALSTRFELSPTMASTLSASLMLVAAVASPLLGMLQDRLHHRAAILTACCALLLVGTISLNVALHAHLPQGSGATTALSVAALALLATGFSAGPVTLMACVALVVENVVAMPAALGMYKAGESGALAVLHVLFGALRDGTGSYAMPMTVLSALAASGIAVALWLGKRLHEVELAVGARKNGDHGHDGQDG